MLRSVALFLQLRPDCAKLRPDCAKLRSDCGVPSCPKSQKKTKKCKTKFFWAGSQCASSPGRKHKLGNRFWFSYKARFQDWPQLAWVWANSMDISNSLKDPCVKWVGTLKSAHIHWNHQKVRRPSKIAQDGKKCIQPRVCQKKSATMESPGEAIKRCLSDFLFGVPKICSPLCPCPPLQESYWYLSERGTNKGCPVKHRWMVKMWHRLGMP